MRIATTTANEQVVENVSKQQSRLSDIRSRLASGLKVDKPSDDPAAAAQAERVRSREARLEADSRMLNAARTTLSHAEGSITSAMEELQHARELLLSAENDTLNADDRASIAYQIRGTMGNLLAIANREDGNGNYVFGGAGSTVTPFVDAGGIVYQPQSGELLTASDPAMPLTQDGDAAFMQTTDGAGSTRSIFASLEAAATALEDASLDHDQRHTAVKASIDGIDGSLERLSEGRTRIGESLRIIDTRNALNDVESVNLQERLSELIDLDYAKGLAEFSTVQTATQAAMQTYASVARLSLFNYLG